MQMVAFDLDRTLVDRASAAARWAEEFISSHRLGLDVAELAGALTVRRPEFEPTPDVDGIVPLRLRAQCPDILEHRHDPMITEEVRAHVSNFDRAVRREAETATGPAQRGKGNGIVKLTTMTQISVDGVMQGIGNASEDRRGGFERGGWALGRGDDDTRTLIAETYQRAAAFLFGRWTYELFAGSWGTLDQMRTHPIGAALNETPKYVASNTLTEPTWSNTTVLDGHLASAIGELKATPGGELQVHGSGGLIRWLLANDLIDEMTLIVIPVIVGQGTRLFPEEGPDRTLDLIGSHVDTRGVTIQTYRPAGRPQYVDPLTDMRRAQARH